MDADKLRELIEDDDLGLLTVKPKQSAGLSEDERMAESFYEISDFYRQYVREPSDDLTNMQEAKLAMRLNGFRSNPDKIKELVDLDEFGLLVPLKTPDSIDDILEDDDLNLLGASADESIFNIRNIPKSIESPDFVAQRKKCEDFERYEGMFHKCHADLKSGKRILKAFANEQQIHAGQFFILRGVMAFVDKVGEKEKKKGKVNARLRCIFENGTESGMLLRSLARELYKDGRRVTENVDHLMDDLKNISSDDDQTGFIYILKSLSTHPDIASIPDLHKIGFSTVPVEDRIKNAADDPTYLMANVHVVETFECFNLNPQKLELLLHRFFAKVCLEVDVFDGDGKRYTPREWFIAPLAIIEEAIELVISGEIIGCKYDEETKLIRDSTDASC